MTLSIVQRLNLGGVPLAPLFASGERLFYRPTINNCRKATLVPAVDALLSNGLNDGGGTSGYKMGVRVENFYASVNASAGGFGPPPPICNFVDLDTGATTQVQTFDPGLAQNTYGSMGVISDRVCLGEQGGGTLHVTWTRCPPNHGQVTVNSSILFGQAILERFPSFQTGRLLQIGQDGGGFNTLQSCNYATPGINTVLTNLKLPRSQAPWTDILYAENNDRIPWYGFVDGGFFYYFCKARVGGNYVFGISRVSVAGGNGIFYNIYNNGTDVQPMAGFNYAWYDPTTRHLAFTTSADGMRVFLVNMAKFSATVPFPWSANENITVDNWIVNNNVTGLYIEPGQPFIYVSKGPGALFGSQFVKIFASALVMPKAPARLGSKPKMRFS